MHFSFFLKCFSYVNNLLFVQQSFGRELGAAVLCVGDSASLSGSIQRRFRTRSGATGMNYNLRTTAKGPFRLRDSTM